MESQIATSRKEQRRIYRRTFGIFSVIICVVCLLLLQTLMSSTVRPVAFLQSQATATTLPTENGTPLSDSQKTLNAEVNLQFTRTALAVMMRTATASYLQTVQWSVNEQLTATAAVSTPTPFGPTQQAETLDAIVDGYFTATAAAMATRTATGLFQQTANAELNRRLTLTATYAGTASTAAPDFDIVDKYITQTTEAQSTKIAATAIQGTISARLSQYAAATAQAIKADLSAGLQLVSTQNAAQITELAVLKGHKEAVTTVIFTPNGTQVVSASLDNTVRFWDTKTGEAQNVLSGQTDRLSLSFTANGELLASIDPEGNIHIWNVVIGQEIRTIKAHPQGGRDVAFSPDGTKLASAGLERLLYVWNAQNGARIAAEKGHGSSLSAVEYSADGQLIMTASNDSTVRIWDASSITEIAVHGRFTDRLAAIAFSPDGDRLAVGVDNNIIIRNTKTGEILSILQGFGGEVTSVAFSPDGALLISGAADSRVRIWNIETRELLATLQGHTDRITSVAFGPDNAHIASASADGTVRIWGIPMSGVVPALDVSITPTLP